MEYIAIAFISFVLGFLICAILTQSSVDEAWDKGYMTGLKDKEGENNAEE